MTRTTSKGAAQAAPCLWRFYLADGDGNSLRDFGTVEAADANEAYLKAWAQFFPEPLTDDDDDAPFYTVVEVGPDECRHCFERADRLDRPHKDDNLCWDCHRTLYPEAIS